MDHETTATGLGIVAVIGLIGVIVLAGTAAGAASGEPTATIEYEPSSPTVDEAVTFVANASDPDGNISRYEWTIDGTAVARSQRFNYTFETVGDHQVRLRVTDDDGNTTTTSTVVSVQANEPPTASIEFSPTSPSPGETVSFQADAADPDGAIETYQWRIDGEVVARERTESSFEYPFKTPGDHRVSVVVTDDDGATTTANTTVSVVEKTANFSIAGVSTTSPVVEGDRLRATATIENVGDLSGNQTVTLSVNGAVRDSAAVTLGGGENRTITLAWETGEGDAGNHSVSVTTDTGSATREVRVLEPATFTVGIDSTNSPVTIGDRDAHNLEINVTVRNVGDQPGNQTVTLAVGTVQQDAMEVALEAGESRQLTLHWAVEEGDAGTYTARVATANNSVRTDVRVNAPSTFSIDNVETNSPVAVGETLNVTVTVSNVGDLPGNRTVTLSIAGEQRDATRVSLAGGDEDSVTLTWATEPGDSGDYTANITVGDGGMTTAPGVALEVDVGGSSANEPPTVSIGEIRNNTVRGETTITPEAEDPDGTITTYVWEVDGEVVSDSRTLEYTFEEPGEYEVALTVTDDDGASTTARVDVTVQSDNDPPQVTEFAVDPDPPTEGRVAEFRADATDPDGDDSALQFEWDFGDGTTATGEEVNNPYDVPGNKTVTLSVTDDDGGTTTVERTVRVNAPPNVSFTVSPDTPTPGERTIFEATATDPDGDDSALQFEWDFGDGTTATGEEVNNPYDVPGNKTITLLVTDDDGGTTTVERTVTVQEPNDLPVVSVDYTQTDPAVGEEVRFTADASDPDGSVESYEWTVDGNPAGDGESLTTSFDSSGDYRVAVTVTDDEGATATESVTVEIQASSDDDTALGQADIEGIDSPVKAGEERDFVVSVDVEGADSLTVCDEGSCVWKIDNQTVGEGQSLTYTFDSEGDYNLTVIITDENGATVTIGQTVTVEPAENDGLGGLLPILLGLFGAGVFLAGGGYYFRRRGGGPESSTGDGGQTQHDEFDSEDKMHEDSGDGDANNMDPSDSAFPPFTTTDSEGANDSGDGDDEDYNETETIIDPEPGGASDSGDGGHTQHDEFDSEDKMNEDSGAGMDPSDSAFPPFTGTDPNGATDSGDGDDEDYNETETIIDPEPGGASDSGGNGGGSPTGESGEEVTGSDGDEGVTDEHTARIDWGDGDETESTGDDGHTQHDEFDSEGKMQEDSGDGER